MNEKQNDRVSFSFGMKLSLPAKYESADFHVSLTSDVNEGETVEQALDRVKREVNAYATKAYNTIRASETGLEEQAADTEDVSAPTITQEEAQVVQAPQPVDIKLVKKQIKSAFAVLEAQKKITKDDFVKNYLNGQKVDQLDEALTLNTLNQIKSNFPELSL